MNKNLFYKQADLLIRILPHIAKNEDFALHGGTAINFFVRNMPRLSVDIDVTYLRILPREHSLNQIDKGLETISKNICNALPEARIDRKRGEKHKNITKLLIRHQGAAVKIEPNQVIRGALFPCQELQLCKKAEEIFEKSAIVKTLSLAELYGSKICAALDRQHPRDLFDIILLFKNEGLTDEIRKAFIVYLISHNRPMTELLQPKLKDMRSVFEKEFAGMALFQVKYEELEGAREFLINKVQSDLTKKEKRFLLSFKERSPKWGLLEVKGVQDLPAVKWKLANLEKTSPKKHEVEMKQLRIALGLSR